MKTFGILLLTTMILSLASFETSGQTYTGGSIGIHFDRGYYVDASPILGYRAGRLDVGISPFFAYRKYESGSERYSYGGRVFSQVTLYHQVFVHGELEVTNVETAIGDRKWIYGLPVGGGYRYNLTDRTQAYGMVLYDLILDDDSPVENPIIRGGVIYNL